MSVQKARVGELELAWQDWGSGPPVLLIMGVGAQMLLWPEGFCRQLAERGLRVIRFDNRDIGRSSWLDQAGTPPMGTTIGRFLVGLPVPAAYSLADMAGDCAGLLDALGLDSAHIVGASMGGMIAQHVAFEHPERARSLTSIMSTSGGRRVSMGSPLAYQALVGQPVPRTAEQAGESLVQLIRTIGSPGYAHDDEALRAVGSEAFQWAHPQGFLRQLAAILADGNRAGRLTQVRAPTLVIHGLSDPLIPPSGARATAQAVPGARLELIEGMGHDMPAGLWPRLIQLIGEHVETAERQRG